MSGPLPASRDAMPVWSSRWFLAVAIPLLIAMGGCSGRHPATASVTGVVRLDGKPVPSGLVTFWPAGGRSASGWIQHDGSFALGTYREGDGATIGAHRITISAATNAPAAAPDYDRDQPAKASRMSGIPAAYSNPDSSGLSFDVQRGVANRVELELSSR